jgi:hypothetical protein
MTDDHVRALAMVSHIAWLELFGLLMKKEIISRAEARELMDRCLLNLETGAALAEATNVDATALARQMCERILDRLGLQD